MRSVRFARTTGHLLFTASDDGRVNVFDTYDSRAADDLVAVQSHATLCLCAVARSSRDSHSASLVQAFVGHTSWVLAVDTSPDGVHIATGCVADSYRSAHAPLLLVVGVVGGGWVVVVVVVMMVVIVCAVVQVKRQACEDLGRSEEGVCAHVREPQRSGLAGCCRACCAMRAIHDHRGVRAGVGRRVQPCGNRAGVSRRRCTAAALLVQLIAMV